MKNRNKANFSTKLVFSKLKKGLRYALKEDVIDNFLIGTGKCIKTMWQGKDIMEVINRK